MAYHSISFQRITLPTSNYDSQHAITDTTTNTPSHVFSDEISKESTFDYLYEFSETRKVLEDFFNEPAIDPILNDSDSVSEANVISASKSLLSQNGT